jgi:hypothetical protein
MLKPKIGRESMATTLTKPRRTGRRRLVGTTCMLSIALVAGACGSSEPSADEAREKLLQQLADSGASAETAICIVDEALERFEPVELVNERGVASPEVDAALGGIVNECSIPEATIPATTILDGTVPRTTVPETTVPETTVPETTVPDVDLTAFCAASEDVYVALLAGDAFDPPSPATMEAFFAELVDRIEVAVVTAPNGEFAAQPNELLVAIESVDTVFAASGYDVLQVSEEDLADEGEVIDNVKAELEDFLSNCDTGTDIDAEANALAEELIALGDVPPIDGSVRRAESVDLHISSDVPAAWTSELGETVDDRRIFIVATDAEGFTTSWGVDGIRFTGLDTTVDYFPLMDDSDAARECTMVVEEDFENTRYVGKLRRYEGCGGETEAVVIGANDNDGAGTVLVELQMVEFDQAVLDLITSSFLV